MSTELLIALCLLLNGGLVLIAFLLKYQASPGPIRTSFFLCLGSYSLWMTGLLLFRVSAMPEGTARLLSQLTFAGGVLSIASLGHFLLTLTGRPDPSPLRRKAAAAVTVAAVIAPFTGFIESGVGMENGIPRPIYGPLHPAYTAVTGLLGLYFLFMAYRGYSLIQQELLKFQMQRIFFGALITFAGAQITNAILPVVTGSSRFSVIGIFWPLFLFAVIVHLLIHGKSLYLVHALRRILDSGLGRLEENQIAMRQHLEAFRFALADAPSSFQRTFTAVNAKREQVKLRVELPGIRSEELQLAAPEVPGLFNRITDLEKENLRLTASLMQAETLLGGVLGEPEVPAAAGLTPLEAAERNTILSHLEKNGFNQAETSRQLGIRPNTLINKMRKYGIRTSRER